MLRYIIFAIIAYALAAPLTSRISFDLTQTEWTNLWTYVWWAGSFVVWGIIGVVIGIYFAMKD